MQQIQGMQQANPFKESVGYSQDQLIRKSVSEDTGPWIQIRVDNEVCKTGGRI